MTSTISRRAWLLLPPILLAALGLALPSCETDGHFTLFGYTTRPNYRSDIKTVRVPIFKNVLYRDSTTQGIEFQITEAVIREIEANTPYKVVNKRPILDDCTPADTELTGTVVQLSKNVINRNGINEIREAETVLGVEVTWKDLRTGEFLSRPVRKPNAPPLKPGEKEPPVLVYSLGDIIPELGQSNSSAYKTNVDRLARQIREMMEQPW
jgi:hypothetical protein